MANFCLIPADVDKFKTALTSGEINPAKLADMTSAERHDFFKGIVGHDNAKGVNALFESKLLLKNQQRGMITWAKQVAGLKPAARRDLIARIEKIQNVLDPEEEQSFLKDLASTKLGVDVSPEEAKNIADMSRNIESTREAMNNGGDRLEYGRAKVAMSNYINDLKEEAGKQTLTEQASNPLEAASKLAGISKSIKASLDDSAIFRQGWKTLWTNPKEWQRNALKTFSDATKEFKGQSALDEVNADILSRPTYDKMVKARLAIGTIEEAYPSALPEKIPVLGRAYKASESAYTGFIYRQRADVFDKYLDIAEKSGVNTKDPEQLQAIGKLVNSLTGRGNLGGFEKSADTVNNIFFSPRFLKSNIDTLTAHSLQKGVTPFVRKQAAINLVKIISGTAAVLATARALDPKAVELDPRSSDFGKIRVGNTRFDVTGGMGSIAILAMQLARQSTKSSTTGEVKGLNSGFGSQTGVDLVSNFLQNKLSPAASVIKDLVKQQDQNGNKPTIGGEVSNLFTPLPISTYTELKGDPHSAPALLGLLADGLGISTNTYGKSDVKWDQSTSKELTQLKTKIGPDEFKKANDQFNSKYDDWFNQTSTKDEYKNLPDDDKQSLITGEKSRLKAQIFKQYDFKPTKAKAGTPSSLLSPK